MLIGDEMGVGKTLQAISLAYLYRDEWPLLIITPASLKFSWKDELISWLPNMMPSSIQVFKKGSEAIDSSKSIFITSYEMASKSEQLKAKEFQCIIADEVHYLKNRDAKRS